MENYKWKISLVFAGRSLRSLPDLEIVLVQVDLVECVDNLPRLF